jgi:hypothetical protein
MNFWSDFKENSYQLQDILKNFDVVTVNANHNEQHNGGWKSFVLLKLIIFTTPMHVVNAKLLIAINHSIIRIFQKFKMG